MTATGDDDGGIAVWKMGSAFVPQRSSVTGDLEHRVFTQARASEMLRLVYAVQDALKDVDAHLGNSREAVLMVLGPIMLAEARYREAIEPPRRTHA